MADEAALLANLQKEFEQSGFVVTAPRPTTLELRKFGCACHLEKKDGEWVRRGPLFYEIQGDLFELEDRGYQKFWFSKAEGRRFPIRKVELETLHRFDAEVRYHLGQKNLYHESLGTTNARTVYDRLENRPDR